MRPNVIFTAFLQLFVKQSVQFRIECAVQTGKMKYIYVRSVDNFVALFVDMRQFFLFREGVQLEITIACRRVTVLHCRGVDTHCRECAHGIGNVVARRVDNDVTPVVVVVYPVQAVAFYYAVEQRLQIGLLKFFLGHFVHCLLELVHGGAHQYSSKDIYQLLVAYKGVQLALTTAEVIFQKCEEQHFVSLGLRFVVVHGQGNVAVVNVVVVVTELVHKGKRTTVTARSEVKDGCVLRRDVVAERTLVVARVVVAVAEQIVGSGIVVDFLVAHRVVDEGCKVLCYVVEGVVVGENVVGAQCVVVAVKRSVTHQSADRRHASLVVNAIEHRNKVVFDKFAHCRNVGRRIVALVHVEVGVLHVVGVTVQGSKLVLLDYKLFVQVFHCGTFQLFVGKITIRSGKFVNFVVEIDVSLVAVGVGHIQCDIDVVGAPTVLFAEEVFAVLRVVDETEQLVVVGYDVVACLGNSLVICLCAVCTVVLTVEYVRILVLLGDVVHKVGVFVEVVVFEVLVCLVVLAVGVVDVLGCVVRLGGFDCANQCGVGVVYFRLLSDVVGEDEFVVVVAFRSGTACLCTAPLGAVKVEVVALRKVVLTKRLRIAPCQRHTQHNHRYQQKCSKFFHTLSFFPLVGEASSDN